MRKSQTAVEHYSKSNLAMHDKLMKRFMLSDKGNDVDMMIKLASSVAYMQQTQTTLTKNLYVEQHIKDINRRLDRIPPELLQSINDPSLLEPIAT